MSGDKIRVCVGRKRVWKIAGGDADVNGVLVENARCLKYGDLGLRSAGPILVVCRCGAVENCSASSKI